MIWFCSFHAIECIVYKTGGIVRVVVVRSNYYCDDQYSILRHIEAMVVRTLARTFAVHYGIVLFVLFIIMDIIQIIIIIFYKDIIYDRNSIPGRSWRTSSILSFVKLLRNHRNVVGAFRINFINARCGIASSKITSV